MYSKLAKKTHLSTSYIYLSIGLENDFATLCTPGPAGFLIVKYYKIVAQYFSGHGLFKCFQKYLKEVVSLVKHPSESTARGQQQLWRDHF